VLALLATQPAYARAHHSDAWAREHFAAAERMREALNGRPPADRTRRDYQRVVNAYREVYLGAPTSTKADPSVVAVAETLVEMGRRFEDDKILTKAIDQYKFLRREYPGSKYRADGLFTVAEIYKDDLNNSAAARATFQEFLRHYAHNRLADDARQAILEIDQEARAEKTADSEATAGKTQQQKSAKSAGASLENQVSPAASIAASIKDGSTKDGSAKDGSPISRGRLPRVTGIRHWSTPDYTRVAIDLESDVKFSSQRIATPARIFFDLNGTKLASTLVGKSFDVDDGFLKKVRVAQFAPGRTRVVLEVDNLSDYDAFLLPNPYRLIIDIHGKNVVARHKDAGEGSSADAQTTPSAKTAAQTDSSSLASNAVVSSAGVASAGVSNAADSNSADTKAAVLTPIASPEAAGMEAGVSKVARATGAVATTNRKSQITVKKVVDADDGDDNNTGIQASATAKQNVRGAKKKLASSRDAGTAPKKVVDSDLASDPEMDSSVSGAARGNAADSRHRGTTRTLASGRSGTASDLSIREAKPTASGDRSLIRALGLKIGKIVIDPGHGGHDTGTIGPNGLEEKDLVLEVGRRLGKLLETRLGAEVVYTRKDDTFIPLETRTAIANQARADLFVSIHANSSRDSAARGVETYYLNFTSSPEALEVAARENAVSEKSIYELQDLVKKIAMKEKIEESREFAGDVQASLHSGLAVKSPAIRDRGVKKAPFIVLIGANMPSILAEISFVSNPTDEHRLATSEYRERIAESLYRGIAKYVNGLSGVKVASKMDKAAGQ